MNVIKWFRSKILFIVPTVIFGLWLVYLITVSSFSSRNPSFTEYLNGNVDVSSEYTSEIPVSRYVWEPFVGFAFSIAGNLENSLITVLLIYVIVRFVFLVFERFVMKKSRKKETLLHLMRNSFNFFWKYYLLCLLGVFVYLLIGVAFNGLLFGHLHWNEAIHVMLYSWAALTAGKILYNIVIFFKPGVKLRIKGKKKWHRHPRKSAKFRNHKTWNVIGREGRYLFSFFLVYVMVCLNAMSINFPTQRFNTNLQDGEILVDFHIHTEMSDGWLSPEERVDWYISQGIHAAAFSDHQNTRGAQRAIAYVERNNLDFHVIMAQEYTSYDPDIHLNIYGIEENIVPIEFVDAPYGCISLDVENMIKYVKNHSGYVTVNHYDGLSKPPPYSYDDLRDWGMDGFEVLNGGSPEHLDLYNYCLANNMTFIAGSDEHGNTELNTFVILKVNDSSSFTTDEIFASLANNTHEIIYVNYEGIDGNEIKFPEELEDFDILEKFTNYLLNLDPMQSLSWILWSCGLYVACLILLLGLKRVEPEKLKDKIVVDERKRSQFFKHQVFYTILIITVCAVIAILFAVLLPAFIT
ncbi:MAG: PHP domain-containing protein [Candidatus Hodarchaeota archaeon]